MALSYLSKVWVLGGVTEIPKHSYSLQIPLNVLDFLFITTWVGILRGNKQ